MTSRAGFGRSYPRPADGAAALDAAMASALVAELNRRLVTFTLPSEGGFDMPMRAVSIYERAQEGLAL